MIKNVYVRNFRNHNELKIELKNQTYIEGLNGVGKSSLLEAIYYVSVLKSFRTNNDFDLIKNGAKFAKIIVETKTDTYEVVLSEEGKFLKKNNKQVIKMSDFIGGYNVVMFSLEDLEIIKGLPKVRRTFMDIEMVQIDNKYLNNLSIYKQVLKQRNALLKQLKEGDDLVFLNIISKRLHEEANVLIKKREMFITNLNKSFKESFKRFNKKDRVDIVYRPDVLLNGLENTLKEEFKRDLITKTTNKGPHRDDFNLLFNGEVAKSKASGGEQRLMMIALKTAMIELMKSKEVIVLLDDVFSELDQEVSKTIENIFKDDKQVVITGTEKNKFDVHNIYLKGETINGNK